MNPLSRRLQTLRLCLPAIAIALCVAARAATPIAIWPLDPVIEDGKNAAALWLENRGAHPATMQIRVLAWRQKNDVDDYQEQTALIASPPFAVIPAGQRQLIRLINTVLPEPGQQQAYRLLVDELPAPPEAQAGSKSGSAMGVQLQMRYSVPLFVNGRGIVASGADAGLATQPDLAWRLVRRGDRQYMEIRNNGAVRARLTEARLVRGDDAFIVNRGLLGYVLPHAQMTWELPAAAPGGWQLQVKLQYQAPPIAIPAY
jgi:fimbrial chaperone protein